MQRSLLEILHVDLWPESREILPGIVRETYCTYRVDPNETFAAVTLTDSQAVPLQEPHQLVVEVGEVTTKNLEDAIAHLVTLSVSGIEPVHKNNLQEYLKTRNLETILCHPKVDLHGTGLSAIRHEVFPEPVAEEAVVYTCSKGAGVLVDRRQGTNGYRGAFIRPREFRKVCLMTPLLTAWERLDQDPFSNA